jgi:hypothetical protein
MIEAFSQAIDYAIIIVTFLLCVLCLYSAGIAWWDRHVIRWGVVLTTADFNGSDWDGSPFKSVDSTYIAQNVNWLKTAVKSYRLVLAKTDTDYAQWDVVTPVGIRRASAGDIMVKTPIGIILIQHQENKRV